MKKVLFVINTLGGAGAERNGITSSLYRQQHEAERTANE